MAQPFAFDCAPKTIRRHAELFSIEEHLGVPPLINAAGTYTVLGSRLPREVLEAMQSAAVTYLPMRELQQRVHRRLAELTRNEAAYVSCGCAASLYLAAAAATACHLQRPFRHLSMQQVQNSEIIMYRAHRNPYDWAIRQVGARLVEVDYPNMFDPSTADDLDAAIGSATVAIYYFIYWARPGALPLSKVIEVAQRRGIPVIVDAAAQLPPVDNLWRLTSEGADAVLFSGGKDLRGPQASGLIVGKRQLLHAIEENGFPNHGLGRMLKVGPEQVAGIWAAVERYVAMDHAARKEWCEQVVAVMCQQLRDAAPRLILERSFPNEAGQPLPRVLVRKPGTETWGMRVRDALLRGTPAIAVYTAGDDGIYVNPMTIEGDEPAIITERLRNVLREVS
jgi:D-glucosaminate-6-phosphate ammonia-lyase